MSNMESAIMTENELIETRINEKLFNKEISMKKQIDVFKFYQLVYSSPKKGRGKGNKKRDRAMKHDRRAKEENYKQYFIYARNTKK